MIPSVPPCPHLHGEGDSSEGVGGEGVITRKVLRAGPGRGKCCVEEAGCLSVGGVSTARPHPRALGRALTAPSRRAGVRSPFLHLRFPRDRLSPAGCGRRELSNFKTRLQRSVSTFSSCDTDFWNPHTVRKLNQPRDAEQRRSKVPATAPDAVPRHCQPCEGRCLGFLLSRDPSWRHMSQESPPNTPAS